MIELFWLPAIVLAASLLLTGVIRVAAIRTGLLDRPTSRSSHLAPTPRGGGVAIVAAFLGAVACLGIQHALDPRTLLAMLTGGGAVAAIGFWDDRSSLPAFWRFWVHIGAASIVVWGLGGVLQPSDIQWAGAGLWLERIFLVIAIAWMINLFNFMDGIDGIAGTEAVFVAGGGGWLNWLLNGQAGISIAFLSLAAASLGFLAWNWPPAKIFMGDVGSGFLGFALVSLGLFATQRSGMPLAVWIILNGIFLVDATLTLLRRMLRAERWLEPHRLHAYQHLSRRWRSHLHVTLSVAAINLIWLLPWAWYAATHPHAGIQSVVAAIAPIVALAVMGHAGAKED